MNKLKRKGHRTEIIIIIIIIEKTEVSMQELNFRQLMMAILGQNISERTFK
jgi:hypothetical protein